MLPVWIIKSRGILALLDCILICIWLLNKLHVSLCIIVSAQLAKSKPLASRLGRVLKLSLTIKYGTIRKGRELSHWLCGVLIKILRRILNITFATNFSISRWWRVPEIILMKIYLLLLGHFVERVCSCSPGHNLAARQNLIIKRISGLVRTEARPTSVIELILSIRRWRKEALRVLVSLIIAVSILSWSTANSARSLVLIIGMQRVRLLVLTIVLKQCINLKVWWKLRIALIYSWSCSWTFSWRM